MKGDVPVNIVRPSIIESALLEPRPGWIRGFRMAEPVIISYARGLLKEFPGVPEGTVDVIPVDLVVGAICAVAALGPEQAPPIVQVASGSTNPLRYRGLVNLVHQWFSEHPLYDSAGQPIVVAPWSFPGRGKVQGQLNRAKRLLERAEKAFTVLPVRGEAAQVPARLEERRSDIERALSYVELYGAYAECEAIYRVDRLMDVWDHLDDDDRANFAFDPRAIDWTHYVTEVHLPSVVQQARVRTTPGGRSGPSREERLRAAVLSPGRHLAAFDLENTLIASNVVESYAWLASRRLDKDDRLRLIAKTVREAPTLLALDKKDRGDFLRYFYRRYEGASVDQLDEDATELMSALILTKSFPAAIRRVREHRALGHRTLLITGALDLVVKPLMPLFDDVVSAHLGVTADGKYTGELVDVPPTGEARAQVMADYAAAEGLELSESVAYADSSSDLPMLEAVGFPVAVNPEVRLATIARKRGWLVEQWSKSSGANSASAADRACARDRREDATSPPASRGPLVKALLFERKVARYAAARVASEVLPGGGARVGPLRLVDTDPPDLPGPGWERIRPRLSGICGSDLATVDGRSTRYFDPIVSFPFVPGHEVVADRDDDTRVVIEPVLGCVARGIAPLCAACARGDLGNCERIAFGHIEPGLQSGFCCDTGGGWSTFMVAHESQLHAVPGRDERRRRGHGRADSVCGARGHGERRTRGVVAVLGAGTLGLGVTAALRQHAAPQTLIAGAKHAQQRALAADLGADLVVEPDELTRAVRRATGSLAAGAQLTGGADIVLDCVGSESSIADALAMVRPRGVVVLVGMPGSVKLDLTTLWHRETKLVGAYAYGTETLLDGTQRRTFDLAFDLVRTARLERLVSATYPLSRYRDAIEHAATAGRRGGVKIAFDMRNERERNR